MKLPIAGLIMFLVSGIASAQAIPGCRPAATAALTLKSIADERGQDAAIDAWHSMRSMQELPVWHEIPLTDLMNQPLESMSVSEVRGSVMVGCTMAFSEFASETAKQLAAQFNAQRPAPQQSLVGNGR